MFTGGPAEAQWVRNPTAVAWVAAGMQVLSPAWHSWLKDLALPQLQCSSLLLTGELPYALSMAIKKKKKRKRKRKRESGSGAKCRM